MVLKTTLMKFWFGNNITFFYVSNSHNNIARNHLWFLTGFVLFPFPDLTKLPYYMITLLKTSTCCYRWSKSYSWHFEVRDFSTNFKQGFYFSEIDNFHFNFYFHWFESLGFSSIIFSSLYQFFEKGNLGKKINSLYSHLLYLSVFTLSVFLL